MKAIPLDLRDGLYARGSLHASLSVSFFLHMPSRLPSCWFFICFAVCARLAVNALFVSRYAVVVVAIVIPIVPYTM